MECPGRQLEHHYFDQLYLELPAACMGDFVFTKHEQIKRCTVDNMIYNTCAILACWGRASIFNIVGRYNYMPRAFIICLATGQISKMPFYIFVNDQHAAFG